ncbi:peptidoglycan-binding domain-containing protein [Streptomyces sp. AK02-01A]|uniref:peptidoglycan-binding domain-containing protein n=1 Tax=Streptomyces sp. AK02-01A TaxID=3028648 RepID=UPI0029B5B8E4|nr:peptidoglycan-binding domain-containing protein [Streptomyces sp. AK02-01A]MDX3849630.1 peptidoglycan-binding domain-containing protein [Streptomyces sp. AK02-01A]MDX3849800.1 peptidoglycan-binding domain-containing protein [Streptomyces sp. AK02-01A]
MTGQLCPECETPRATEGRPGCDCADRATQAVQAGRSAEIAAAEDFDPLRLRPYVTLGAGDGQAPTAFRTAGPLPPLATESGPVGPPAVEPLPAAPPPSPSRRKPFKAVVIGAAAIAVIGTAVIVAGLFPGDRQERALPDETLPPLPSSNLVEPDASTPSVTASASHSAPATVSSQPAPPPAPTASAPRSTAPRAPSAPASAKPPTQPPPQPVQPPAGGSLSPGDSGPEVVELQNRLEEIWLYRGPSNGEYDQRVEGAVRVYQSYKHIEGDPEGVYGPNTRRALEAETRGRGRGH